MPEANGAAHRKHDDGSATRAFTIEQKTAVIRVRKCKATDFYDILGLEGVRTTCTDSEIKKAYRKLSLLTHPDKNGYTGADEAFKMVSRAFQILSDSDKKAKYDRFGGDPDNRFASASASGASPFSNFAQRRSAGAGPRGPGGGMFEEEMTPEELFRQFFGGGAFGGPFGGMGMGGGPGFMFNMGGGPGVRIHQFGGNGFQRRPHNHANAQQEPRSFWQAMSALMPLVLLFLVPLLSSIFSGSTATGPTIRVDRAVPPHTQLHTSNRLSVPYWVNPSEVQDFTARKWKDLDKVAEGRHINQLEQQCQWEQNKRQREMQDAIGFFYTDQVRLKEARTMEMPSCKTLEGYGYWR